MDKTAEKYKYIAWTITDTKNLPFEKWKSITGFEGYYEVSNYCRIKSLERIDCKGQHRKMRIMKLNLDSDGYPLVILSKDRKSFVSKPHRLGAIEFIPNPANKAEVNHKYGIKTDTWVGDLEWNTNNENITHALDTGLRKSIKGEKNYGCVLLNEQVLDIFNSSLSVLELSKKYNIGRLAISRIKIGKTWAHLTGKTYIQKKPSFNLNDDFVLKIFNEDNGNCIELGVKYNVPRYVVANIKTGKTYSNITGKKYVKFRNNKKTR